MELVHNIHKPENPLDLNTPVELTKLLNKPDFIS
jgi:hypothetical protein